LFKKCFCGKSFQDETKPKNKVYCSEKCRHRAEQIKQHNKIYHHNYYLRKIKPSRSFSFSKKLLGTVQDYTIKKRIETLKCIYEQQLKNKLSDI